MDFLVTPKVNKEVWTHKSVKAATKTVDLKYQKTQTLLVKGLIPLLGVIDSMLSSPQGLDAEQVSASSGALLESVQLFASANHEINYRRKDNFRRALPANLHPL